MGAEGKREENGMGFVGKTIYSKGGRGHFWDLIAFNLALLAKQG